MEPLTHGTNLALAPTLGPLLRKWGGTVQHAVDRIAQQGFASVQLDATIPTLRPRELSRSGRRDLAALLRRRGADPAGLDLFIPPWHYTSPDHGERAVHATHQAIELAADLGHLPLSLALPVPDLPDELARDLVDAADRHDVSLAVHDQAHLQEVLTWADAVDLPALGAGFDPAMALSRGEDPVQQLQQAGRRLSVARLSDLERTGAARCAAGSGQLDLAAYRVSVDLAENRAGHVVLELRGLNEPLAAAQSAAEAWERATFTT
jgi:sugar phosphate isomerase/epimerase